MKLTITYFVGLLFDRVKNSAHHYIKSGKPMYGLTVLSTTVERRMRERFAKEYQLIKRREGEQAA
jgi:hypothetical protein